MTEDELRKDDRIFVGVSELLVEYTVDPHSLEHYIQIKLPDGTRVGETHVYKHEVGSHRKIRDTIKLSLPKGMVIGRYQEMSIVDASSYVHSD